MLHGHVEPDNYSTRSRGRTRAGHWASTAVGRGNRAANAVVYVHTEPEVNSSKTRRNDSQRC